MLRIKVRTYRRLSDYVIYKIFGDIDLDIKKYI